MQQLEADKNRIRKENCRLRARSNDAARKLWYEMGKRMGFLDRCEPASASDAVPHQRIEIDPEALPGGVARPVAQAPNEGMDDIREDEEPGEMFTERPVGQGWEENEPFADVELREAAVVASQTADSTWNTKDASAKFMSRSGTSPSSTATNTKRSHLMKGKRASSTATQGRQSASNAQITQTTDEGDQEEQALSTEGYTTVDDALASAPVTDDETEDLPPTQPSPPPSPEQGVVQVAARKRKVTPPSTSVHLGGQEETEDGVDDDDGEESQSPPSRSSRRSSVRSRASINYALPKLNTKMRKPDPEDRKPAASSARKGRTTTQDRPAGLVAGDINALKAERQDAVASAAAEAQAASTEAVGRAQQRLRYSRSNEVLAQRRVSHSRDPNRQASSSRSASGPVARLSDSEDGLSGSEDGSQSETIVQPSSGQTASSSSAPESSTDGVYTRPRSPVSSASDVQSDSDAETDAAAKRQADAARPSEALLMDHSGKALTSDTVKKPKSSATTSANTHSVKRPLSASSMSLSAQMSDADLALLASGISTGPRLKTGSGSGSSLPPSLADLASSAMWPSTPQVGVGRLANGGGRSNVGAGMGTKKVSVLSKFNNGQNGGVPHAAGGGAFIPATKTSLGNGASTMGNHQPVKQSKSGAALKNMTAQKSGGGAMGSHAMGSDRENVNPIDDGGFN